METSHIRSLTHRLSHPLTHSLTRLAQAASLALGLLCSAAPAAAAPTEAQVKAHVETAERAAGSDLQAFFSLCKPASPKRPEITDEALAKLIATPGPEGAAAFDNLYYLGSGWVSAWLLKTSDGLVLIDALNTAEEVDRLIVGGMKKLGLDPKQIKLLVVTHGHGDHYGGAQRIKEIVGNGGPRIVMSEQDWQMTAGHLEFESRLWPAAPTRTAQDIAARDGDVIQQGDSKLTLHITPGHTLGTVSPVIEVQTGGRTHRALIWGGTGFNFGRDYERLDAYIASTVRMQQVVREQKIDVLLSNHPSFDGTVAKLAKMKSGGAGQPNPYVVGSDTVLRALTVAGECARANRVRFEMLP